MNSGIGQYFTPASMFGRNRVNGEENYDRVQPRGQEIQMQNREAPPPPQRRWAEEEPGVLGSGDGISFVVPGDFTLTPEQVRLGACLSAYVRGVHVCMI